MPTKLQTLTAKSKQSKPHDLLMFQIKAAKLPTPEREYRFHSTRKWRFDLAWPEMEMEALYFERAPLAVEIDGGGFIGGRHGRGLGIEKDCEKYAEALLHGWRILRVTPRQVKDGRAILWIQELLR